MGSNLELKVSRQAEDIGHGVDAGLTHFTCLSVKSLFKQGAYDLNYSVGASTSRPESFRQLRIHYVSLEDSELVSMHEPLDLSFVEAALGSLPPREFGALNPKP